LDADIQERISTPCDGMAMGSGTQASAFFLVEQSKKSSGDPEHFQESI